MKNKEKTKPTKRKILTFYLILAACLLVIAAITVGVIFGTRQSNVDGPVIDSGNTPENPDKPDKPDTPDTPDTPNKPTNTQYEFIMPIKSGTVTKTQDFAYDKTMDWYALHEGMDFAADAGAAVVAAVDGTIVGVTSGDTLYDGTVTIEHADGVTTVYRFIDLAEGVSKGAKVNRGDVIGTIAATKGIENADGNHLHFEIYKNNVLAEPDDYLEVSPK